ncbi:hypothetical protein, partial [Escherichia coli]|uniref:hypothetical protein n=1 Tax=Escherichia coli TaxID=562 RepID=UPI001BAF0369
KKKKKKKKKQKKKNKTPPPTKKKNTKQHTQPPSPFPESLPPGLGSKRPVLRSVLTVNKQSEIILGHLGKAE